MKNLKFFKEPGYTYDLFFIFMLYFNKKEGLPREISCNKTEEDIEYFNNLLNEFLPISDELLLFFYLNEGHRMFMTERCFEPYKAEIAAGKYNLPFVLENLANYEQVVNNVLMFYFRNVTETDVVEYRSSITAIHKLIKESKYNNDIKSELYSFFIEPVPIIQKLIYELMAKEILMAQEYEKNVQYIAGIQERLDYEELALELKQFKTQPINIVEFNNINISFCAYNKNLIFWFARNEVLVMILGVDYLNTIRHCIASDEMIALDTFGNAMAEKNRVKILDLMLKNGEITIKDIEQELGFTGTNAYYHLVLMLKAEILKTRNQGRTVLYSINKGYFERLCDMLKKYL